MASPLLPDLAMKLGTLLAGALLLGGCFLPQEDNILEPLPQKNRPPRILEKNVLPPIKFDATPNERIEFSAAVEDPDVDDRVKFRWYVDYSSAESSPNRLPVVEGTMTNNGNPIRGSVTFVSTSQDTPLSQTGTHVVTLMVYDRPLGAFDGPGSTPDPDPVEGVDAGNPGYSTSFNWTVTVCPVVPCTAP